MRVCALDDYAYSAFSLHIPSYENLQFYIERGVRHAVQNGGIVDIARAVFYTVHDNFHGWQGTFSAVAIFSLHPAVLFGESAYPLTMLFTLLPLIGATLFLAKTILKKDWFPLSILLLFASIQWVPSMPHTFFWWNGATFYTLFFCIVLVSIALKIRLYRNPKPNHFVGKAICIFFIDFFIAGGNFVTALLNVQINLLLVCYFLARDVAFASGQKSMKRWVSAALFAAVSAGGLLVSALAPGNAVRQAIFVSSRPVLESIWGSIVLALNDIIAWTTRAIGKTSWFPLITEKRP